MTKGTMSHGCWKPKIRTSFSSSGALNSPSASIQEGMAPCHLTVQLLAPHFEDAADPPRPRWEVCLHELVHRGNLRAALVLQRLLARGRAVAARGMDIGSDQMVCGGR